MRIHKQDDQHARRGDPAGSAGPSTEEDLAAYEALVRKYGPYVYNIAYRMSGGDADAKDLAQEAFIRVFRAFQRIDPQAPLEAWLYRIVRNLYIDLVRKHPKGRVESLSTPVPTPQGEVVREWPGPEGHNPEAIIDRYLDEAVQQALLDLTADLRMVVVLCDIEGLAYEEIARMLEVPLGTVKSRIHRARRILQERLARVVEGR